MRVANTIINKSIKKAASNFVDGISDGISYIDNRKFKNDIQQISDTVADLLVSFDIFEKDNEVVGTARCNDSVLS